MRLDLGWTEDSGLNVGPGTVICLILLDNSVAVLVQKLQPSGHLGRINALSKHRGSGAE